MIASLLKRDVWEREGKRRIQPRLISNLGSCFCIHCKLHDRLGSGCWV